MPCRELYIKRHFTAGKLPLTIYRYEYKRRTDHWHCHNDFMELVVVTGGSGYHETQDGENLRLWPGSILLMGPGSIHRYSQINNLVHYNILFPPEFPEIRQNDLVSLPGFQMLFQQKKSISPLMHLDGKALPHLIQILENARQELVSQGAGWQTAAQAEFLRSVVFLSRHATPQNQESGEYAFHIGKILRMMEQRREHNFTLEELAAHAQMSVSNFRHQFIKITGSSPINYLIRLRLKKSVALLVTPIDISHAAAQCGFSDSNYLARQFRKYLGMSPGEFKHRYGRNEITIQEAIDLINGI